MLFIDSQQKVFLIAIRKPVVTYYKSSFPPPPPPLLFSLSKHQRKQTPTCIADRRCCSNADSLDSPDLSEFVSATWWHLPKLDPSLDLLISIAPPSKIRHQNFSEDTIFYGYRPMHFALKLHRRQISKMSVFQRLKYTLQNIGARLRKMILQGSLQVCYHRLGLCSQAPTTLHSLSCWSRWKICVTCMEFHRHIRSLKKFWTKIKDEIPRQSISLGYGTLL